MPKQTTVHSDTKFGAQEIATLDFINAQFEDCTFDHGELRGRDLRGAKFLDCTFTTCDLVVAKVIDCTFSRVRFQECRLSGINWSGSRKLENVAFHDCQLNDGSFLGLRLEACEFIKCLANGTSFRDANLAKAKFRDSDLTMAEFVNCDLREARTSAARSTTRSAPWTTAFRRRASRCPRP